MATNPGVPGSGNPAMTTGDASDNGLAYVRGGGVEIDSRRAKRVVVWIGVGVLAALVIILTITAIHKNDGIDRLARHGVPVQVTVTGCVALASGTGATIVGYTCRGTFTLDGRLHHDAIGGSTIQHAVGQTLRGVTDPSNPGILSTARAVATTHASWTAYIAPGIALVLLILVGALVLWRVRRARRLAV
jgi:hypothetical protein